MTIWYIKSKAVNTTVSEFLKISFDKGLNQYYSFLEILTCASFFGLIALLVKRF